LGVAYVKGRSRVPLPPTRMIDFKLSPLAPL
jgi:hypothetical protein